MNAPTALAPPLCALIFTALILVGCNGSPSEVDPDPDPVEEVEVLVRDGFARTANLGWGRADVGPFWHIAGQEPRDFRVEGGHGFITKDDDGPRNVIARSANSTEGYGMNVRGTATFRIEVGPDDPQRFFTVETYARRNDLDGDGGFYYRYRVRLFGFGRIDVRLEKRVDNVSTWISDNMVISTVWEPGQTYRLRWEAIGSSPTAVRFRIWPEGTQEPSAWHVEREVNEPNLDIAGTTGFRFEGPSGSEQTSFPVEIAFGSVEYVVVQ
jgi:trimeric autotransporter adhesin